MRATLILGLGVLATASTTSAIGQICDLTTIDRAVVPKEATDLLLTGVSMSFSEATYSTILPNGEKVSADILLPRIQLTASVEPLLERVRTLIRQDVTSKFPSDLDVSAPTFESPAISARKITVPGRFKVEKWWKTDGFCCHNWECRRCEWKTRVWERTVNFEARLFNAPKQRPDAVSTDGKKPAGVVSDASRSELRMKGEFASINDRSDLEKLWDGIAQIVEGFGKTFGSDWTLQFNDFLGQRMDLEGNTVEPNQLLSRPLEENGGDPFLIARIKMRPYETRDVWESFNESIYFSEEKTGFSTSSDGGTLQFDYKFDYDKYSRMLRESSVAKRLSAQRRKGRGVVFDILDKSLCNITRAEFESYMDRFSRKLSGEEPKAKEIAFDPRTFRSVTFSHYGLVGSHEYFRGQLRGLKKGDRLTLPSALDIGSRPGVMPAQGTLDQLAREQGWTASEVKCAKRKARKRSGSEDLTFPFQSFEECLDARWKNDFFDRLSHQIEKEFGANIFGEATAVVPPLRDPAHLRGWYYCYQNLSICAGKNRVTWWTEPSKFKARGGKHLGVDLIHGKPTESISIQAVVDGQLIYNNLNPTGWGHALIIPFSRGGKQYMAVYAHLPSTAKSLDARKVKAGDSLGLAGCSGNAGDGFGRCNSYCDVGTSRASDIHLHFQLLEKKSNTTEAVDPATVIPLNLGQGPPRRLYVCEDPR